MLTGDEIESRDTGHQPQRVLEVGGNQQRFERENGSRGWSGLRQDGRAGFGGRNREQNHGTQQADPGIGGCGSRNVLASDVPRHSREAQKRRQRRENDSSESHVYLDFTMLLLVQMDFEQQINQLQDTLIVTVEIQRREAEIQKTQAERIVATEEGMKLHEQRMSHIELNLSEISDKLNGLIGFMNGYFRQQ